MQAFESISGSSLPNFLVIGAMKCGTSSLHYYLDLHPQISMSSYKEPKFFVEQRNWRKGIEWYKAQFQGAARVYGEVSPQYTYYPYYGGVSEKIASILPEVKLIYILRDPAKRIVSHYMHWYATGTESRGFSDVFKELNSELTQQYLWYSKYFMQLEQYLKFFDAQSVLVLTTEELYKNRLETLRKIFEFIGVSKDFCAPEFNQIYHQSEVKKRPSALGIAISKHIVSKIPSRRLKWRMDKLLAYPFSSPITRPDLDENTRGILMSQLADDVQKLREFTGKSFEAWDM